MMMPSTNTHMKPGKEHFFKTPVSSMMAIFPLLFWDKIVEEINRYAAQKIKLRLKTILRTRMREPSFVVCL
jgi:hypothetical protein